MAMASGGRKRIMGPERSELTVRMGGAIRRVRVAEGVSQSELAGRMGCSQQYVSKIERGGAALDAVGVNRIARALGVPIQRFYAEARKNI